MIGVFDSGVGGLSVLGEIRKLLPEADLVYVADRARAPYGPRSLSEVREISLDIAGWLVDRDATTLVVACNTASAAGLESIRRILQTPGGGNGASGQTSSVKQQHRNHRCVRNRSNLPRRIVLSRWSHDMQRGFECCPWPVRSGLNLSSPERSIARP